MCATLHHPGIVKVLGWGSYTPPVGEAEASAFMVMELVQGSTLREFIEREKNRADPRAVLRLAREILQALRTAHVAHVVHRDLKPENIMINRSGHVKVLDFGLARELDTRSITQSGDTIGTPHYMSPEHLRAKSVQPASDLYSLGVIIYEMLTGAPPFDAPDAWTLLTRMLMEDPTPLVTVRPDVGGDLSAFVMKMMARELADRFSTAEEALAALDGLES